MIAHRPWLGVSTRDWFINSDTPQKASTDWSSSSTGQPSGSPTSPTSNAAPATQPPALPAPNGYTPSQPRRHILSPPNHTTRQDAKSRVTRFGLSHEDIKSVRIPVPPGEEQAAIVKYLAHANARIDTAVAAKRRLIALLEEQKLATMAGLIGEMDGERMRLKRVASIQTGLTLGKDYRDQDLVEYPYLRVANVQMGHVDTTDLATVKVPVGEAGRCMLRRGDVLMTEGGDIDKLGRGTVWDGSVEPCLHQNHVFAVRCQDLLLPEYLAAWLATPEPRYYFYVTAKKTTNLAATNSTTVRELPIVLSAVEEQRALLARAADFAAPMVDAVTRTAREIALLQEFRVRLVADVVTGQVDVRGIATSLPEIDLTASWGDSASVEDADGADFDDVMEASED